MKLGRLFYYFGIADTITSLVGLTVYFVVLFEFIQHKNTFHYSSKYPRFQECFEQTNEEGGFYQDKFVIGICLGIVALIGFTILGTSFLSFSPQKNQVRQFKVTLIAHVCCWTIHVVALFLFIFSDKCIFDHQKGVKYNGSRWQHGSNRDVTAIILICYRPYEWFLLLKATGLFKNVVGRRARIVVPPTPAVASGNRGLQNRRNSRPQLPQTASTTSTATTVSDDTNSLLSDGDYAHLTQLNHAAKRRTLVAADSAASIASGNIRGIKRVRSSSSLPTLPGRVDKNKKKTKKLKR
ncbi:unnamed protein product [Orchesella dallaii]|uniref:Uncharacterized protein n=1 Tax=Orchesella dallaii TaxID=48710 RepID=A0ABP1RXS1_9HEXA